LLLACGADGDARPAQWSYLHAAIVRPSCATASCHARSARAGDLDLGTSAAAYQALLGGVERGPFVTPRDPARSRLVYLLEGRETLRMPPDQPLPQADIELIERWILAGAMED
jgi:hypothetical protein